MQTAEVFGTFPSIVKQFYHTSKDLIYHCLMKKVEANCLKVSRLTVQYVRRTVRIVALDDRSESEVR